MNWFDIFILVLIIYCVISGYKSGLIKQLASAAGIIVGAIISGQISTIIYPYTQNLFGLPSYLTAPLSYAIAFLIVLTCFYVFGMMLNTIINSIKLGTINKIAGATLCLAKWVILVSILINVVTKADEKNKWAEEKMSKNSYLYSYVQPIAPTIIPYLRFSLDSYK